MVGYILKLVVILIYTFALMYKMPTTKITKTSIKTDTQTHNFNPIGTGFNVGLLSSV